MSFFADQLIDLKYSAGIVSFAFVSRDVAAEALSVSIPFAAFHEIANFVASESEKIKDVHESWVHFEAERVVNSPSTMSDMAAAKAGPIIATR